MQTPTGDSYSYADVERESARLAELLGAVARYAAGGRAAAR